MFSITANDEFIPAGVGIDPQGHVFVADTLNQRVQKFSNNGTFIRTWGTFVSSPGQFDRPIDLAVDPQGHVFTVEFGGDRVQKFSNTGKFIRTWGKTGSNDSEFNAPVGIGIDPQGHVFTSEQSPNNRVQKFSNTGNFIRKWAAQGRITAYSRIQKVLLLIPKVMCSFPIPVIIVFKSFQILVALFEPGIAQVQAG